MNVALAILIVGLVMAGVLYRLGSRLIEVYSYDVGGAAPDPVEREPEEDEEEDVSDEELVSFVSDGVESIAAQQVQAWVEQRREDGLSDREIREELETREPLVII